FLGAEPRIADEGKFAGVRVFDAEQHSGLAVYRSLSGSQLESAVLCASMQSADLPPHLNHPSEGRHRSGAGQDNLVLPYEGWPGAAMTGEQRDLVLALADVYVRRWPERPARAKLREVSDHLDDTWFAFVGSGELDSAMYYRIHSPVLLIEFDHHKG